MTDSTNISEELGLTPARGKPGPKPKTDGNRITEARNTARSDRSPERADGRMPDRVPVHMQNGLDLEHATPGFHGHWVADRPGRIDKMLRGGYRFKTKDGFNYAQSYAENGTDSRISRPGGGGELLYFMEIPQELYDEDQLAKNSMASEQLGAVLPHDPGMYSRDDSGREVAASKAVRVDTQNNAY